MEDILRFERSYPTPLANSPLLSLLIISLASQKNAPDTKDVIQSEYDYIIVGAGTAGSVVAGRLSEKRCVSVLVLEEGTRAPRLTDIPAMGPSYIGSNASFFYPSAPQKHCGSGYKNRGIPTFHGKMFGGSSAMNHMVFARGNRKDYDDWAKQGAHGWNYENVLPYFKKLERDHTTLFDTKYHGYCGPIPVERPPYDSPVRSAFMKAVRERGYPFVEYNGRYQCGFSDQRYNAEASQRWSSAKGYLVPAEMRKNLDIVGEAVVTKVVLKNRRAVGVKVLHKGEEKTVRARREVIVSAGGLRSPQILMLSGLGPRKHLEEKNITVVLDLPVGRNLQDHPIAHIEYETGVPLGSFSDRVQNEDTIYQYLLTRSGLLASQGDCISVAFLNSGKFNRTATPDYALYIQELPTGIVNSEGFNGSESFEDYMKRFSNKTILGCLSGCLHERSRGFVELKSNDIRDHPLVDFNFFDDKQDLKIAVEGLKLCVELFESPAMQKIGTKPLQPPFPGCEQFKNNLDDYLTCIAPVVPIIGVHFAGSNAMGRADDPTKVVDPKLRVRGIRGLRVIDGSIMPLVPSSNTMVPVMMLAEKGSDLIKESIRCRPRRRRH